MGYSPAPSIRLGYVLAAAAFLVQGPRLLLTTLAAHRLPVSPDFKQLLLSVIALATAALLTGGGMYIGHAALSAPRWRIALGVAWVLVLGAYAGLVAPAIAGGLANQELHEVIGSPGLRQAWALLAALAHELTAAGCILAAVARSRPRPARGLALPASR